MRHSMTRRSSATGAALLCPKRRRPHSRYVQHAARWYRTNRPSTATAAAQKSCRYRSYAAAAAYRLSITCRVSVPGAEQTSHKNRFPAQPAALPAGLPIPRASRSTATAAGHHSIARDYRHHPSRGRHRWLSHSGNLPGPFLRSWLRIPTGNLGTMCLLHPWFREKSIKQYRNLPYTMTSRFPLPLNTMPTSPLLPMR